MRWLWFATLTLVIFLSGLFTGLLWLWAAILILIEIMFFERINWPFIKLKKPKTPPFWAQLVFWLIISSMIFRAFVFESFTLTNTGMQETLQKGDNVLVSKLKFGPRLAITPINFPFVHHYLPFSKNKASYLNKPSFSYYRFKGFREIQRGDLLAYNFPEGDTVYIGSENISYYAVSRLGENWDSDMNLGKVQYRPIDRRQIEVSRCLGIPGDTIHFENGYAYTNGTLTDVKLLRQNYLIKAEQTGELIELFKKFGLESSDMKTISNKGYVVPLSLEQADKIKTLSGISEIQPYKQLFDKGNVQIYPHDTTLLWNSDRFGPVIVPTNGILIDLNLQNIHFYERLIRVYEGNSLQLKDSTIYINDVACSQYKVKMDYYFVLGDNRQLSRDSRHWGFLPEDHIIGKPWLICLSLSTRPGKGIHINWERNFDIIK